MRKGLRMAGVVMAAGIIVAALAVSGESRAQDGLAVGVQGAFTQFDGSIGGDSSEESGVGGGLVVRLTTPIGDTMFAGVHASWSFTEGAEWEERSASNAAASESISVTGETKWSADLLARVGTDLGGVDAYVAAGLAFASFELGTNVGIRTATASGSRSESFSGYKLAAGVDLPISETLETFVQIEYADYGDASFAGIIDLELTALAVRTGLLYRF